jgi:pimeloyl-ACP methyl ester carboxylesterase
VLDYTLGRAVGATLPGTVPLLLGLGLLGVVDTDDLQQWAIEHPELVQHLVNGGGGLLDGVGGSFGLGTFTPDTESAAGLLAALYGPEGDASVEPRDVGVAESGYQPGSVADVIAHLGELSELSGPDHPENNGTIEIQTFTDANGEVRHIVYLPGTDDMTTLPWTQDGDVRDLATNLQLVAGHDNAYQQGILEAMHQAGIGGDEPVLLAGHSQGGMEAAAIASQGSPFNVTNVVTAGSPTAQVDGFPPGTHVLSLEHQGDVVPLLDGEENPDSAQQVTVHFADGGTDVVDHHSFPHYVDGAAAVDASQDPSIVENLHSLVDNGFLGDGTGSTVTSQTFQITRDP